MRKKCVTLWHKQEDDSFSRTVYENCFVTVVPELEVYGSVRTNKNTVRVRIYSRFPCAISTGDKLCIGKFFDKNPPNKAHIIARIKENLDVSARVRHYRIDCV